ncbi:hypothetical protein MLD38_010563 [Melastoma candidum]|uniref:Uncharacterized protein n=1 Tax=Melastoma candidum TaxID=119954 RepID=A0ACB9R4C3_9MYRT|nr:hypothetical protein MLD38_010563 [Melastoma candidum]
MSILDKCKCKAHLNQAHALIVKTSLHANHLIVAKLLRKLLSASPTPSSSDLRLSSSIFRSIPSPDSFLFNTIIRAHLFARCYLSSWSFFARMVHLGIPLDSFAFSLVLQACGRMGPQDRGRLVHSLVVKLGFQSDIFVQTALVEMYSKSGCADSARTIFYGIEEPDTVSYNVLLAEYVRMGEMGLARDLFDGMPNRDLVSWNTMIHGYASVGNFAEAKELFERTEDRDAISWSSMIGAYARTRQSNEAVRLFYKMQAAGIVPDKITMVSVLSACGDIGALGMGRMAHQFLDRNRIEIDMKLGTSLIDMYSKCGDIDSSLSVFNVMKEKDVFTWSAMIIGLANHGSGELALEYFSKMIDEGIAPNDITFVGVLSACSHRGLVDVGRKYFYSMNHIYGVAPKIEHYGCMVDILARAGHVMEARQLIGSMPFEPDAVIWRALLSGCRTHKHNDDIVEEATVKLLQMEPIIDGNYLLLSNLHTQAKKWDEVSNIWRTMREMNLRKIPGSSSIEVNNTVHEFLAGDRLHPQSEQIFQMLDEIYDKLKNAGHKPLTCLISQDLEENEKEAMLAHHSEKLAVAYGLLYTDHGSPIRIVKNLRVCEDCHVTFKLISLIYDRKIIVRDRNRFHHFNGGACSCKDYW